MLQVQHFVVHNIRNDVFRHIGAVELAIDHDLLERRIEAAKLRPPDATAPTKRRFYEQIFKIARIQSLEHWPEIVVPARRTIVHATRAPLAEHQQSAPRGVGISVFAVRREKFTRRLAPIKPAQQDSRSRFENVPWRVPQQIRNANVRGVVAQSNRMRQVRVGMVFHDKMRRSAFAADARVDPLENALAARNQAGTQLRTLHGCFLRTGGGAAVFRALSTSVSASLVPSIASNNVSL